jgi:hypothetical protein
METTARRFTGPLRQFAIFRDQSCRLTGGRIATSTIFIPPPMADRPRPATHKPSPRTPTSSRTTPASESASRATHPGRLATDAATLRTPATPGCSSVASQRARRRLVAVEAEHRGTQADAAQLMEDTTGDRHAPIHAEPTSQPAARTVRPAGPPSAQSTTTSPTCASTRPTSSGRSPPATCI